MMVFLFVFDRRRGSKMEALLNTAQTIFICFLLGFGAMTFSNDANKLVLTPIERMIAKIDKIRNNPLAAMTIGDEEHRREEAAEARKTAMQTASLRVTAEDSFQSSPSTTRGVW